MFVYDTLGGRKAELVPREPGRVGLYVCGPTVYDVPHLGHGRSALVFDTLRRVLTWRGHDVTHVSNITDVDDKIINRARLEATSEAEVAARFEDAYWHELGRLGVERPHHIPHATGYIDEMLDLIARLVGVGAAYTTDSGAYFSVASYPGYGELSSRRLADLIESAGGRVDVDEAKRSPVDFALWKAAKPDEPAWDSPFGRGRPGWHIECSAMSVGLLGPGFDLHGGGDDLAFPHHENERAQSEQAGVAFARHWMHHGMVNVSGEKMSKSLGNFTTLSDALDAHDPRSLRLLVLQTHYRSTMEMGRAHLAAAAESLGRLDALVRRARLAFGPSGAGALDTQAGAAFTAALDDDMNTPAALAAVFEATKRANQAIDSGDGPGAEVLIGTVRTLCSVLGLDLDDGTSRSGDDSEVAALVTARDAARQHRDFAEADRLRDELTARGITLEDTPTGTVWRR